MTAWRAAIFGEYAVLISQTCWIVLQRVTIPEILDDEWFRIDYKPPVFDGKEDTNLDDVEAVFKDSEVRELFSWTKY